MGNAAAYQALDEWLDKLRASEHLNEDSAKEIAVEFKKQVRANVAAQVDPYGHPWPASKDGLPLLINAADAVECTANGTEITMTLEGVEARHHIGNARGYHGGSSKLGGFRRPIIPFKSLPGPFRGIVRKVLTRRFGAIFGGAD